MAMKLSQQMELCFPWTEIHKKGLKQSEEERKCTGVTEEVTAMKKKSFPEVEAQMLEGGPGC